VNAREQILGALRTGLHGAEVPPLPAVATAAPLAAAERAERFAATLAKVGGVVERVADFAQAAQRARDMLAAANVRTLARSDAPELAGVCAGLPSTTRVLAVDAPRDELLAADAGLTTAQWGIAETGTLVLVSALEQHRLASLLPPLHVAILPVSRLLGTLGDAFAALRAPDGRLASRTITFVTGPSRTADIELTLVVGVHGPKALHVLLVDGA
jgi:L-lactate dehydrogenase complex protein LldG